MKLSTLFVLTAALFVHNSTFASGFEKSIPWGGQTSGVAGIGSADVQNSTALFFNPANLAGDEQRHDVSLNISPTFAQFKGPLLTSTQQETAEKTRLFPSALTWGKTLNEKLGVGAGVYVSGGTHAKYTGYTKSPIPGDFDFKTELTILELAAGVGYKVSDKLKLGLSWRAVQVSGAISTASQSGLNVDEIELSDLKDTKYTGYKLGAQYKVSDKTDIGFTYRSEVDFEADGNVSVTRHTIGGGVTELGTGTSKVGTLFPAAWNLSVSNRSCDNWRLLGEYVFTEYRKVTNLAVTTSMTGNSPIELQWKNQHNVKVGAEYKGFGWPVRFGYVWTSQVTNHDTAKATMVPPSHADTLTLGTGKDWGALGFNIGAEYTKMKGNSSTQTADFEVSEYAVHTGLQYNF